MEAFTATLALDPTLLRGLRHSLAAWLEGAGASVGQRNSVVLATHEATAHVMQTNEGGTVDVSASRDGDDSFVVHVRSDGAWEIAASEGSARSIIAGLMGDVSTRRATPCGCTRCARAPSEAATPSPGEPRTHRQRPEPECCQLSASLAAGA